MMAQINLPDLKNLNASISDLASRTGYPASFKAYLGKGDGVTVTDPDYPVAKSNQYVWYHTEEGRQGHAILGASAGIPYANQAEYHGLPVQVGRLPDAFNIKGEVIIGVGGAEGMAAVGGTSIINNSVVNNYYTSLDRMLSLRLQPSSGMTVLVNGPFVYTHPKTNAFYYYDGTGTLDLTTAQATCSAGQHCIATIYLDPYTQTLGYVASTPTSAAGALPSRSEITPATLFALNVTDKIRIGPVYLYYGQTMVIEADILRRLDYRSLFVPPELVLVQDVSLAPGASSRNVIEATADTVIPLTIQNKPASGYSPDALLRIKDESGNATVNIDWLGKTNLSYWDSDASQVAVPLTIGHNTSATPDTNFGSQIVFQLKSTTTNDTGVGGIRARWEVPTHATRKGTLQFYVKDNSAEYQIISLFTDRMEMNTHQIKSMADPTLDQDAATKIYVDTQVAGGGSLASAVILAPGGSTRNIILPSADYIPLIIKASGSQTADLFRAENNAGGTLTSIGSGGTLTLAAGDLAISAGKIGVTGGYSGAVQLVVTGAASQSVDIFGVRDSGGNGLCSVGNDGTFTANVWDAGTTTVLGHNIAHKTSGTPAAGFGAQLTLRADDNGSSSRGLASFIGTWIVATDASRNARLTINPFTSAGAQEVMRFEGTGPAWSVFGHAAAAQQTVTGLKGGNAALGSLLTILASHGIIIDSSGI